MTKLMTPEEQADFHMREAARDMYAVLQSALEFVEQFVDVKDGDDGQPEANEAMVLSREIKRVIEKAEGAI